MQARARQEAQAIGIQNNKSRIKGRNMSSIFGGGGTVNTVQKSDPWAGQQPYLYDVFNRAGAAANQPISPYTLQSRDLIAQRALDPNSLIGQSQSVLGNTISGKYLDPSSNPFLAKSVSDALGQAGSAFAGQYGGAAGQNLGNSGYQEALARGLGAVATNAYSNAYSQERQNQLNATQLAPSLDYANLNALGAVGEAQNQDPWTKIANYSQAVNGTFGGSSQGQSPYYTNPIANALGLGLGGAALYKSGIFGGAAAAGAGAGAAGGGGSALFNILADAAIG